MVPVLYVSSVSMYDIMGIVYKVVFMIAVDLKIDTHRHRSKGKAGVPVYLCDQYLQKYMYLER